MLVDTHAHLNFPDYEKDLDRVIGRAVKNGVEKIICVSSNLADSVRAIEIAKKYPKIVYAAVGIHPQQTDPKNTATLNNQIAQLAKLAQEKAVVAIGECGLDYSPAPPPEKDRSCENQDFLFQSQIKIAKKFRLPIMVHSREAFAETLAILGQYSGISGVLHCYSGGKKGIAKVLEISFYFGLDGNLTYDIGLQNVVGQIPLEKIILETDSPLLTPLPFRDLRNEPQNVKIIAESLAKIKNVSFEKICQITAENTLKLFKIE